MRDGFIKVAAATPEIKVAHCDFNAKACIALIEQAAQQGANPEGGAQGADGNYYDAGFEDKTNG